MKILESIFPPVTNEKMLHLSLSYSALVAWWRQCFLSGSTACLSHLNSLTYMMADLSCYLTAPCKLLHMQTAPTEKNPHVNSSYTPN